MKIGDSDWPDYIVGDADADQEPVATTQIENALGSSEAYEILGDMLNRSPAFADYVKRRVERSRPMTHRVPTQTGGELDLRASDLVELREDVDAGLLDTVEEEPPYSAYAADFRPSTSWSWSGPIVRRTPLSKARDWSVPFGPVSGAAGSTTTLTVAPQCLFRGEKVMATDTATPPGTGTRVLNILVGSRRQMPASHAGTSTQFFGNNALGSGVKFDTCEAAMSIHVTVSFIQACTFDMQMFGKAVA